MATSGTDLMSDEVINIKCCVCLEENRTREAEHFCVDCKNYYCSSCVGIHQKIPMMKGHTILRKTDFKTLGPDGSLPSFPTQRCSLHVTEVINMYCKDHDEVECASCIALNHRSCQNILSIPENIDNLFKNVDLNDVKLKSSTTKKKMEKFKKTKESKLQEVKGDLNQKIQSVKAFHQELQALLVVMEQETIQELRREFKKIEASLEREINEVDTLVTSIDEAGSQLEKYKGYRPQEYVCVKSSQKLAARGEYVENNQQIMADETVLFTPDQSIKEFLQQKKSLGSVSVDKPEGKIPISKPEGQISTPKGPVSQPEGQISTPKVPVSQPEGQISTPKVPISQPEGQISIPKVPTSQPKGQISIPKVPISKSENQIFTPKDGLYRVKQLREINVKLQNDKNTCYIWGCCITEEGYLLLADGYNRRLKCVDLSTDKVKDYIDLPADPCAVCTVSQTEAAVILENYSVQFVSLGHTMIATHSLTMKINGFGLAYNDGRLFISDTNRTVYIYDKNGKELSRITQDSADRDIFESNRHIAVNSSGDRVFVTDIYKGLVVFDCLGKYLSTLSDKSVTGCYGVCTDGKNVFVAGNSSGNIVQFGQNFRMLGEIGKITDSISLCFDHQQKRLIATCHGNDKITILELE